MSWLREPAAAGRPAPAWRCWRRARDLRSKFAGDPDGLMAWCLGAEAAAGRFAPDLLPDGLLKSLARDPRPASGGRARGSPQRPPT